jgi:hypothetical protein
VPFVYLYTFLKIEYLHGFSFLWHRSTQECESRSHLLEYVRMTFWDHKIKKIITYWWKLGWQSAIPVPGHDFQDRISSRIFLCSAKIRSWMSITFPSIGICKDDIRSQ